MLMLMLMMMIRWEVGSRKVGNLTVGIVDAHVDDDDDLMLVIRWEIYRWDARLWQTLTHR